MLTFGSLFAGIGGFDLGFERAGMKCIWQVEIDEYATRVLAKHWPDVRRHGDVRTWLQPDTEPVDVICGGFPCQDISNAGKRAGLDGNRSGLFYEIIRIAGELRPRYIVLENVAALLNRGFDRVLGELATLGFDAEWHCIPASAVGAPHQRDRVWIIAYATGVGRPKPWLSWQNAIRNKAFKPWQATDAVNALQRGDVPVVCREHHGVPNRVDRLRCLGNAIVPQVAELVGRRVIEIDQWGKRA